MTRKKVRPFPARALDKLLKSLGENSNLLQHLPENDISSLNQWPDRGHYHKTVIQVGMLIEGQDTNQVWAYLLLETGKVAFTYRKKSGELCRITDNNAYMRVVLHTSFRAVEKLEEFVVLARYYFLKKEAETGHEQPFTEKEKLSLLDVCGGFRAKGQEPSHEPKKQMLVTLKVKYMEEQVQESSRTGRERSVEADRPTQEFENDVVPQTSARVSSRRDNPATVQGDEQDENVITRTPTPVVNNATTVEQYMELQNSKSTMNDSVDVYKMKITELRVQLAAMQKELEDERIARDKTVKDRSVVSGKIKRMWSDMSKDEIFELGRREGQNKKSKTE